MISLNEMRNYSIIFLGLVLIACSTTRSQENAQSTTIPDTPTQVVNTPIPPTPTPDLSIIFDDDFEDKSSGWDIKDDDDKYYYENGKYHIGSSSGEGHVIVSNPKLENIDDFSLEIDVYHNPEYEVSSGIIFRYQDADNFYVLWQFYNGSFGLAKRLDGETIVIGGPSTAEFINTGADVNHITLDAFNDELVVYINDEMVVYTRDNSFRSGSIKLYSSGQRGEAHEAIFDNLVISQISDLTVDIPIAFDSNTIIQDNFEDNSSEWLSDWSSPGLTDPEVSNQDGTLHIQGSNAIYFGWNEEYSNIRDFVLNVDIAMTARGFCQAGIAFRANIESKNGYRFLISNDGRFQLAENYKSEFWSLTEHSEISYLAGSHQFNHITLKVVGPRMAVYINDELATFMYDNTTTSGVINLIAIISERDTNYQVIFDNLEVAFSR